MESRIVTTTLLICALLGVIIAFFISSIILYHRRYIRLQRERISAEIQSLENDRKRIATDLHDSLGPILSGVKLNISSITVPNADDAMILQKATGYIDDIIQNMRKISYDLLPNTLDRRGLLEALQDFASMITANQSLHIDIFTVKKGEIQKEKEIHIFRILQEIIHNTLKHAKATLLNIGFSWDEKELLIMVEDNGVGFDVEKAKDASGLGLKSLEIRTDVLGGRFTIQSKIGKGTRYYIRIPHN
jgi:signal transduction histidine kinase